LHASANAFLQWGRPMKFLGSRLSVCWLGLALLATLEMEACRYGGASYESINGYMTGPWDSP